MARITPDEAEAQCMLGESFGETGAPHDQAEAARVFHLAADQGHARARYNLGICHVNGLGVPQDQSAAARLFRLAADQGHEDAQCLLGVYYNAEIGVQRDLREAARFYRLAADQGHAVAQCGLGIAYQSGSGVPRDEREAARLHRLAADRGNADAQLFLGNLLLEGSEQPGAVPRRLREGALLLAQACQNEAEELSPADRRVRQKALEHLSAHAREREVVRACCIGCGKSQGLTMMCDRCRVAKWCGRECFVRMWPVHKPSCELWAKAPNVPAAGAAAASTGGAASSA